MIMTYDWLQDAIRGFEWKKTIEDAMLSSEPQVLFLKSLYRLSFDPLQRMVAVYPFSKDSKFSCKITPKILTYQLVSEVINGNWEAFSEDNIFDIDER